MITDDELRQKEAEVEALFGGASPWTPESTEKDEERIRRIMSRVKVEALVKDSVSFIFKSFGATLSGVTGALLRSIPESPPKEDDDSPS